jgi:NAD(P)-dependent dehydrogenase (short-subunit alcohol dehydrogenase family)
MKGLQTRFSDRLEVAAVDLATLGAAEQIAAAVASWPLVDILINNAGVFRKGDSLDDFQTSFQINAVVPLFVARALFSKLKASSKPKAIQITSLMGSIDDNQSGGSYAYRASKAALNMVTKTIAQDEKWLTTAVVHPGWVKTRMGGSGATTPVEESVTGIWRVIEKLEAKESGSFFDYEGDRLPW